MTVTARALNRATLARQLLLRREPLGAAEAVRRLGGLQAQEHASPYLALWTRLDGFDAADLDEAFGDRRVVKASLMRLTLHAVHAEDYPAFYRAMVPSLRASRLHDRRFEGAGVAAAEADAVVPDVLRFLASPRTSAEVEALLADVLGDGGPRVWWALRRFAPLHHAPTGPPWSFGTRPSYVAAGGDRDQGSHGVTAGGDRDPGSHDVAAGGDRDPGSHGAAVRELVLRFLEAFGPSTVRDLAQFTMLRVPVLRAALRDLDGEVAELEGPDGARLLDVPGAPRPPGDTAAPPRLLPMWDSVLLAYADRSRVIPPEYRPAVIRRNGDVLPALLVDGYVAGVWRPVPGGIEATAFHRLDGQAWRGLAAEARGLLAFLAEREPLVYRRYARWWRDLPGEEVRVLPGGEAGP